MERIYKLVELPFWLNQKIDALYTHLCRYYLTYILGLMAYWLFALNFTLSVNLSVSLPDHLYLVQKGVLPKRGEYVAISYGNDFIYFKGTQMIKRCEGVSGDMITSKDRKYYVNGKFMGEARTLTTQGNPIQELGYNGHIPAGHYYLKADHLKSFDSRYAAIGLVPSSWIIGRAFPLF
ncbi:MAG: signal peptidase I [Gallionellales bacterium CG03_land_8_20_14_0_80_55_15]|nr:MAG: signal peptidase I [Gallionellales bacterium CG03_land_8_20_14_0_80_55_15]